MLPHCSMPRRVRNSDMQRQLTMLGPKERELIFISHGMKNSQSVGQKHNARTSGVVLAACVCICLPNRLDLNSK